MKWSEMQCQGLSYVRDQSQNCEILSTKFVTNRKRRLPCHGAWKYSMVYAQREEHREQSTMMMKIGLSAHLAILAFLAEGFVCLDLVRLRWLIVRIIVEFRIAVASP
jgi:hypothetical protein